MKFNAFLLASTLLLFASCEFTPTGTNVREVTLPASGINLIVLNENSINVLRGQVNISYREFLNNHTFRSLSLYLNDQQVSYTETPYDSGAIPLYTEYKPDGDYILRVVLVTSTNSGSLADRFGAEIFYTVKEYPVKIYNGPLHTPQITGFEIRNGALVVKWEKFAEPGFQRYVLTRINETALMTTNVDQTEFVDSTYFGRGMVYRLTTYAFNTMLTSELMSYQNTLPTFVSATVIPDNKIQLTWNRNMFDPGFGSYRLIRHEFNDAERTIAIISNINDTVFVDQSALFGGSIIYDLKYFSKDGSLFTLPGTIYAPPLGTEFHFPTYDHFEYIPSRNIYFQSANSGVSIIDASILSTIRSVDIDPPPYGVLHGRDMSNNGEYVYSMTYFSNTQIKKLNKNTLDVEETIDLASLLPSSSSKLSDITVSDSNLLAVTSYGNYPQDPVLSVIDMNTRTTRASLTVRQLGPGGFQISESGEYILLIDSLFRFNGSVITRIGRTPFPRQFAKDNNYIVRINGNQLQKVRCSDLQVVNNIPLSLNLSVASLEVDRKTGYAAVESGFSMMCEIYNIETGIKVGSIPAISVFMPYQNGILFAGDHYMVIP